MTELHSDVCINYTEHNYSRFWLIGPMVNRGSRLYGTNCKERNVIEKIASVFFAYLGQHAV